MDAAKKQNLKINDYENESIYPILSLTLYVIGRVIEFLITGFYLARFNDFLLKYGIIDNYGGHALMFSMICVPALSVPFGLVYVLTKKADRFLKFKIDAIICIILFSTSVMMFIELKDRYVAFIKDKDSLEKAAQIVKDLDKSEEKIKLQFYIQAICQCVSKILSTTVIGVVVEGFFTLPCVAYVCYTFYQWLITPKKKPHFD